MSVGLPATSAYHRPSFRIVLSLLACLGCLAPNLPAQTAHFSYGGSTIAVNLDYTWDVAVDRRGNLYVAGGFSEGSVSRVLKLTPSEGSYTQSIVADAAAVGLSEIDDLAVDRSGNVYVEGVSSDDSLGRVLKLTPSGSSYIQSIVADENENDQCCWAGIALDDSGNVFIADYWNDRVLKETVSGANYTQSTIGDAQWPQGVAVDLSGNVYALAYHAMIKFTFSEGNYTQSTIGDDYDPLAGPAVDYRGNVYFAANNVCEFGCIGLMKLTPFGGSYTESGVVEDYNIFPAGVAVDDRGDLYVADLDSGLLKLALSGADFGSIQIGSTSATIPLTFTFDSAGTIGTPAVLTMGAPNLDFTDAGTGTCTTKGTSHNYAAGDTCTVDVRFSPKQAGTRNGAVVLSNSKGVPIATAYMHGTGVGAQIAFSPATQTTITTALAAGNSVAVDGSGDVYIADSENSRVLKETLAEGSYAESIFADNANNGLNDPTAVAIDGAGNVYIADALNVTVLKETPTAGGYAQSTIADGTDNGLLHPSGLAVDSSGNVYIADDSRRSGGQVLKLTPSGNNYTQSTVADVGGTPMAVTVDGAGNVYISEKNQSSKSAGWAVYKAARSRYGYTLSTVADSTSNGLDSQWGVAVDGTGNVYIADSGNDRVLKETPSGDGYTQSIFAGISGPVSVAVDENGSVYIGGDQYVVKEDVVTPPSFAFAATGIGSESSDSPKTATIWNDGNAPLVLSPPSFGTNPSVSTNFVWDSSSTCAQTNSSSSTPFTLAPGGSCTAAVDFIPTSVGSITGSVILTDNDLNAAAPGYASQSISFRGTGTLVPAAITSPAPGSALSGSSTTFNWTAGSGVTGYYLWIGTAPGGHDLANLGQFTTTSTTVTLPTTGATIYVRLWSVVNGRASQYSDYTYTETYTAPAAMSNPAPGSTLSGVSTTLHWTTGSGATGYYLWIGTSPGAHDLANLGQFTTTSTTVTLPTGGASIYVRLWSVVNGRASLYNDSSYTTEAGSATTITSNTPIP